MSPTTAEKNMAFFKELLLRVEWKGVSAETTPRMRSAHTSCQEILDPTARQTLLDCASLSDRDRVTGSTRLQDGGFLNSSKILAS
jgi:hypothetical protein